MTTKEKRELLKFDEGFVKMCYGYSKSNYNFESYFRGFMFSKADVKWGIKNKIWEIEENRKFF